MQIAVADRTSTNRTGRARSRFMRAAALMALGALVAGCTSSRDTASDPVSDAGSTPGSVTSTPAMPPSTPAPATPAPITPAPATPAPSTVAETTTTVEPTTTTTSPPTTTTAPLVTEGAVVLVANATKVPGGAGRLTNELNKLGYHTTDPTNAAGNEEMLDATKIYFLPAGEAVATGLAALLGVPLARMPTPAPITDATAGLGEATVLVMLGKDFAGKTPPGLEGR